MMDSEQLLYDFAVNASEEAFRELVRRYIDLVFATASRLLQDDSQLAEDVTQIVFVDLARKARGLSPGIMLGGWLHRHTYFVTCKVIRAERRRRSRERQAVDMNSLHDNSESNLAHLVPLLDEAINQLRPVDRSAIVMRFFEQRDFRSIAEALGASENAAQKRVARALEQLHTILKRRGVACSSTALGLALTGTTAKSAPAGLATSIAAMALVKVPTQTGIVLNALKLMTASNLKTTLIGAVVVVGIITPLFVQEQGQAKLRDQQDALQQLQLELAAAQINIGRAETGNLRANFPASLSNDEFRELLRLRGEIWKLRETDDKLRKAKQFRDTDDHLAADQVWSERVNRLKAWLQAHPSEAIPELSQLPDKTWINSIYPFALETDDDYRQAMAVVRDNAESPTRNALFAALRQYVANDNGQWPTGVPQLAPYFTEPLDAAVLARYAIVPASTLVPELQTGSEWAITENAPIDDYDDRFAIGLTNSAMANSMVTNRWTALP